jgi:excisionase family DNA binding protein
MPPTTTRNPRKDMPPAGRPAAAPADLITVSEAAKLLRVSRRTVERLVARGALPFYELPVRGGLRFDRAMLHAWLARRHRGTLEGT